MKFAIVIPAYNSETTIGTLLNELEQVVPEVPLIVVDDGSSDRTGEISRQAGAMVLVHKQNQGKGQALQTGFARALELEVDFIGTLDADGQHSPQAIPDFLTAIETYQPDLVIGNRMHDLCTMPFHRMLSNKITSGLISLRVRQPIADSQCGFRFIRTVILRELSFCRKYFDYESEIVIKAGIRGYRCVSVPIDTIYNGESSAIRHVRDTLRFITLFFESFLWK